MFTIFERVALSNSSLDAKTIFTTLLLIRAKIFTAPLIIGARSLILGPYT
jgi:hypothetical protein